MIRPCEFGPIFFDLDGTLADSADGIVASLEHAVEVCGIVCTAIDWRRYIGPPLPRMLEQAMPDLDDATRRNLVAAYREHYARVGIMQTRPFTGVDILIEELARLGTPLHVVTNKPQELADTIVRRLGFAPLFRRVVGGDPAGRTTKGERLAMLVAEERCLAGTFIGDSIDDKLAADRNGSDFILAGWGYGVADVMATCGAVRVARSPEELSEFLGSETA